jgi:hypothetical protein
MIEHLASDLAGATIIAYIDAVRFDSGVDIGTSFSSLVGGFSGSR